MVAEYAKKTNAELIEILKSRSLTHTGKKADLVARLEDSDRTATEAEGKSKTAAPADNGTKDDAADDVIDWDDDPAPAEAPATTTQTEEATEAAAGGKGAVSNLVAVPNQQVDTDPSTTHDLNVVKPGEGEQEEKKEQEQPAEATGVEEKAEEQNETTEGSAQVSAEPAEGEEKEAPAVDFAIGLAASDFDSELAKRKARAEKFGVVEDAGETEAEKAIERAKRFGIETQGETGGVKGLDEALPSEKPRKRGRGGDDGDNQGRGKRRDFQGRGRRRQGGHGGRPQENRGGNNGQARNGPGGGQKSQPSEGDIAAMERRKARFA